VEDGRLVEFFEFRHLTFQEFLTARAMVEGWHPGRKDEDTLVSVLDPHIEDEKWREVIPLAAVLGGKQTDQLIQGLTERVLDLEEEVQVFFLSPPALLALGNCLADEAAAPPATIREAIRAVIRRGGWLDFADFTPILARGRYGNELRAEAASAFFEASPDLAGAGQALQQAVWWQTPGGGEQDGYQKLGESLLSLLDSSEIRSRCEGALGIMGLCFQVWGGTERPRALHSAGAGLQSMLFSGHLQEQFASAWALVWLGACRAWAPPAEPDLLGRLFELWRKGPDAELKRMAGWALRSLPLASREDNGRCSSVDLGDMTALLEGYDELKRETEKLSALIVAWYLQAMDDTEIARRAQALLKGNLHPASEPTLRDLLERLGEPIPDRPSRERASRATPPGPGAPPPRARRGRRPR
jgi:hypothetical protein